MNRPGSRSPRPQRYCEIVVKGEFGESLTAVFDDLEVVTGDRQTVLTLALEDQSQVYEVLDRLRDLAIEVTSVREFPSQPTT